jgi:hypothetical protein
VHGIKTIEIRSWPTQRRGRVLIHAAGVSDRSEHAWSFVPAGLRQAAERTGGIVGVGELTDCIAYRTAVAFAADVDRHRNDPAWYRGPVLYGFCFAALTPLPFRAYPGWVRFFSVHHEAPRRGRVARK